MLVRILSLLLLGLSVNPGASQAKFNKVLSIGQPAPAWAGLPGVDGKEHALADLKDKELVVLVVTCNHCPIAIRYEERIVSFAKAYAGKSVALVAVNVNHREADRLPKMQTRAKERGFDFPYLFDESQKIGHAYGATATPEFFVLDRQRRIAYMGAMDDRNDATEVEAHYLRDAVESLLQGRPPSVTETKARGCAVEYEKK